MSSELHILESNLYQEILDYYIKNEMFFPIISSVLEEKQRGLIIKLSSEAHLVIHHFGFAQFIGKNDDIPKIFNEFLDKKLYLSVNNIPRKLRIYSPKLELKYRTELEKSYRFKMKLNVRNFEIVQDNLYELIKIDSNNFDIINDTFEVDLETRFWKSKQDFLKNSYGYVLRDKKSKELFSLCYAAAISNNIAEMDILTLDEYKNKGYGEKVAKHFIRESIKNNIEPSWDCFSNNLSSINLSKKLGFEAVVKYNFFTVKI